jgi:hypothetical protein
VEEDVRSSARWARRPSPKSLRRQNLELLRHPRWESGCLGHANVPRDLPKYEVIKVGDVDPKGNDDR